MKEYDNVNNEFSTYIKEGQAKGERAIKHVKVCKNVFRGGATLRETS